MSITIQPAHDLSSRSQSAVRGGAALLAILLAARSVLGTAWHAPVSLPAPGGVAHLWLALALVLVAHGLACGAREAWTLLSLICLADLGVALGAHAPLLVVATLGLTLTFLLGRAQFTVPCPTPARRLAYAAVAVALGGTWLLPGLHSWATVSLQAAFMLVGTAGVLVLLRPVAPPQDEMARATLVRALLGGAVRQDRAAALVPGDAEHSPNPIWGYALESDKAQFASARWPGGVAYRVCAGVALAVGEPIGPSEARLGLAAEFGEYCRARGWLPAFYQVQGADVDAYRAVGLRALKIGEEAMIDLPSFTLAGKRIANVRHCVTHVERAGLTAEIYPHGVADDATLDGIAAVSSAWLGARAGRGEMGFSMGSFSRDALSHTCTAVARDADGQVQAFVTFRSVAADRAMVLDLMRRGPGAPAGTIDFLIARALEQFREQGLTLASLSLAPLANAREAERAPRLGTFLAMLYEKGNGLYRYKSLYNFKRKFAPRWEPRYLLYPSHPWALPRVALAVALVHLPRGTVRPPGPAALARGLWQLLRGALDWRHGLQPGPLARTLSLMVLITLAASVPELWRAAMLLAGQGGAAPYAALSLALAAGNAAGAVGLARHQDAGRRLLALGALGFFPQIAWGLAAGYVGGRLGWGLNLATAPVEAWMIWFLLQPEVRMHLRAERARAGGRRT